MTLFFARWFGRSSLMGKAIAVTPLVYLVGCGHPATTAECAEIVEKVADLELASQHVTDPDVIARRKDELKKKRGDELTQRCAGRRVTDAAMACVRRATSYEEIETNCLR